MRPLYYLTALIINLVPMAAFADSTAVAEIRYPEYRR